MCHKSNMSPENRKSAFVVSEQVRHKLACKVEACNFGFTFVILDLRKSDCTMHGTKNKGADQLCSYCTTDLCLCFQIGFFTRGGSYRSIHYKLSDIISAYNWVLSFK